MVDGGYVSFTKSGTGTNTTFTPTYHFYMKDHLGSNRVVASAAGTAEQVNHYYPYGSTYYNESTVNQRYKYCGKELDRMHGLNWYDSSARYYDHVLGRFHQIDPLAEKYYSWSPYAYCMGNPIRFIDPDGTKIIPYLYTKTNNRGFGIGIPYRSMSNYIQAMKIVAKTTYGRTFLSSFLEKGHIMYGVKGNGKYSKYTLEIKEFNMQNANDQFMMMGNSEGSFNFHVENGNLIFTLSLDIQNQKVYDLVETILHEIAIHGSKVGNIISAFEKGGIEAVEQLRDEKREHDDLKNQNEQSLGVSNYLQSKHELIESDPAFEQVFEKANEDYQQTY